MPTSKIKSAKNEVIWTPNYEEAKYQARVMNTRKNVQAGLLGNWYLDTE